MPELIAIVALGLLALLFLYSQHQKRILEQRSKQRAIALSTLPPELRSADESTQTSYRLLQSSVRELEHVLQDDMIRCTISDDQQHRIEHIINDFYREGEK